MKKSQSLESLQDHPGPSKILAAQGPFDGQIWQRRETIDTSQRDWTLTGQISESSGHGFCFCPFRRKLTHRPSVCFFQGWMAGFPVFTVFSPMSQASNLSGPRVTDLLEAHVMLLMNRLRLNHIDTLAPIIQIHSNLFLILTPLACTILINLV